MNAKKFLALAPILLIFGFGILMRSTNLRKNSPKACGYSDLSGILTNDFIASFEGNKVIAPSYQSYADSGEKLSAVLGVASVDEKWIEVDLSEQKLRAWDGDELFLETLVSSGLPHTPTPTGEFRVWIKLRATKMEGGEGRYYYYLPNVPYVMFFENEDFPAWLGYGLHGTYWHSDFGTQRSHGCVNLPTTIAEKLYYWTTPVLPDGKTVIRSDDDNPGTRVIIHE